MRSYVTHFTREILEVDKADDKVQLITFKAGLKSREFVVSLAKNPLKMMAEILLKAQKYMNAEDALAAIKEEEKIGNKGKQEDDRKGRKRKRPDHQTSDESKRKDEKTTRTVKFTPLVIHVDKIWRKLRMSTTSNGQGHYICHPTWATKRSIVGSIRITATTQRIVGT